MLSKHKALQINYSDT